MGWIHVILEEELLGLIRYTCINVTFICQGLLAAVLRYPGGVRMHSGVATGRWMPCLVRELIDPLQAPVSRVSSSDSDSHISVPVCTNKC